MDLLSLDKAFYMPYISFRYQVPPANTMVLSPGWSRPFTDTVVFQTLFDVAWSRPYHTHPILKREETEDKGVK